MTAAALFVPKWMLQNIKFRNKMKRPSGPKSTNVHEVRERPVTTLPVSLEGERKHAQASEDASIRYQRSVLHVYQPFSPVFIVIATAP